MISRNEQQMRTVYTDYARFILITHGLYCLVLTITIHHESWHSILFYQACIIVF